MSIFDNIGRRVSDTAKTAAKKSGDIVEATKLNINIAAEEDKIKRVYTDIGKAVYQAYVTGIGMEGSVKEYCEKVKGFENNIEEMKQKILELRNVKACPECGIELHVDMAYCHNCGEKQQVPERKVEEAKEGEEGTETKSEDEKAKDKEVEDGEDVQEKEE